MWKFRLARFARSRKLPCQNIVKKCDDNNYTNSIVMRIMITNTSARPMCKASTLISCRFIWYPSPHTKKLATPLMSPWQKKIVSPLRSLPPPPPPIQNCFRARLLHGSPPIIPCYLAVLIRVGAVFTTCIKVESVFTPRSRLIRHWSDMVWFENRHEQARQRTHHFHNLKRCYFCMIYTGHILHYLRIKYKATSYRSIPLPDMRKRLNASETKFILIPLKLWFFVTVQLAEWHIMYTPCQNNFSSV